MKLLTNLIVLSLALASVNGYPAKSGNPEDDAEFIIVPLERQKPSIYNSFPSDFGHFDGVIDTDSFPARAPQGDIFFPSVNPFTWQLGGFIDDLMTRLRNRFATSWSDLPFPGSFGPGNDSDWPVGIPSDAEDGKVNTTSTVKVINGHKVIINDTFYAKTDDFGQSVFKVRVIDVKPLDDDDSTSKEATTVATVAEGETIKPTTRDTEEDSGEDTKTVDDSENAISDIDGPQKGEEPEIANDTLTMESFEDALAPVIYGSPENEQIQQKSLENSELLEDSDEDVASNNDAGNWNEFEDDLSRIIVSNKQNWGGINQNQLSDDIDVQLPIDLTNDIRINTMLANERIPLHPDAEVFALNQNPQVFQDQPDFSQFPQQFPTRFPQFPQQFPHQFPQNSPNFGSFGPQQFPQNNVGPQQFPRPQPQPQPPFFNSRPSNNFPQNPFPNNFFLRGRDIEK